MIELPELGEQHSSKAAILSSRNELWEERNRQCLSWYGPNVAQYLHSEAAYDNRKPKAIHLDSTLKIVFSGLTPHLLSVIAIVIRMMTLTLQTAGVFRNVYFSPRPISMSLKVDNQ